MKVLSGIQPTGRPHWGNYFGAISQYIALQNEEQAYYFVADLHALTTIRDKKILRENTFNTALDMLALGLDPNKAVLFVQSGRSGSLRVMLDPDFRHSYGAARTMRILQR